MMGYMHLQLKTMLLNLYKKCNVSSSQWSELILDAQWRHATEQDYENKIKQLEKKTEKIMNNFYIIFSVLN